MNVYLDTSALLKLFVEEPGSGTARALWEAAAIPLSSRLAYPEARAALSAAARARRLTARAFAEAKRELEAYWAELDVIELAPALAALAGDLAERLALRGADAVHLTSAIIIGSPDLAVASWDHELRRAAIAAGLSVVPASVT